MAEHPIEGLMLTAMSSIKDMIDVNTIIGDPIQASNNIAIIPISKVSFGFVAGGSEFKGETVDEYNKTDKDEQIQYRLPFGGGSGAGVTVNPVAFLVVQGNVVKMLPVDHSSAIDKLLDYIPDLFEKVNIMANKCIQNKKEQTEKIINQMQRRCKEEEKQRKCEEVNSKNNIENNNEKDDHTKNLNNNEGKEIPSVKKENGTVIREETTTVVEKKEI